MQWLLGPGKGTIGERANADPRGTETTQNLESRADTLRRCSPSAVKLKLARSAPKRKLGAPEPRLRAGAQAPGGRLALQQKFIIIRWEIYI